MTGVELLLAVTGLVGAGVTSLRWLRVAQREHYQPGRVTVFARRWWVSAPTNVAGFVGVLLLALAAVLLGSTVPWLGVVLGLEAVVLGTVLPAGLSLRGRTSVLHWTRRLRTIASIHALLLVAVAALAVVAGVGAWLVVLPLLVPGVLDGALALDKPLEDRLGGRYVAQAQERLERVRPTVVGITGSYGKTTVKNYVDTVLSASQQVVASRRSFNNRLGLATSINGDLEPGTDVFVAEYGTYGPGEIRAMCSWLPPEVAVMTAIGPVHLERMGSLDTIVRAKRELLEPARVAVLNVDDERLRPIADERAAAGEPTVTCSTTDADADVLVAVDGGTARVVVGGEQVHEGALPDGMLPTNVALAVGVAVALEQPTGPVARLFDAPPEVPNRLRFTPSPAGHLVVDDTFNSNPAGAGAALAAAAGALAERGGNGYVVTPGMVELGPRQDEENAAFAEAIGEAGFALVVVGRSNAAALRAGYRRATGDDPVEVAHRDRAVEWVRERVTPADVVLFENDLPDHFP